MTAPAPAVTAPPVVLTGAAIVTADGVERRSLALADGRVVAAAAGARAIDLRDHLILPGLVNAHDHLQVNAVPPLPGRDPLPNAYEWARAFDGHFVKPAVRAALAVPAAIRHWHGGLKNLLAGVTTVAHHDPWHPVLDEATFPVGLLRRFGWCHSLGLAPRWDGLLGRLLSRRPLTFGPPARASFRRTPTDAPWIIHLAEGTDRVAAAEGDAIQRLGLLRANTVLVHAVGLDDEAVARTIAAGAAVVWCPASNLAVLGKTLSPRKLFAANRLALGTDSRLSGSRDLLDELRVAAEQSDLSARELFLLAGAANARVLRMPEIGGLDVGRRADIVIVRDIGIDPYQALIGARRADLRAVVRGAVPMIADADFAAWFQHAGVPAVAVRLDGQPKILAQAVARPEALALEPGLEATTNDTTASGHERTLRPDNPAHGPEIA
jgi:cytosine/adenosine deaminase-related metal-dependent hydrolase